ncbi:glycine cleavage system protein GcvH [Myxococcota bacterium]|nr:glycine cleavage system protein GcvH [Myxococcota bacterium]
MSETEIPANLKYSAEDEWARDEEGRVTIGITHYAQDQLGDIVFVELPEVGRALEAGEVFGVIESVKAVSDLYAPVAGEIVAINGDLESQPELVNADCYGSGWMCVIQLADKSELQSLLDAEAYGRHVQERDH